jgi:GxxExxY protein
MGELLLKDEVYAAVGAAMEVHSELGAGFLEAVYQEAMAIEMTHRHIVFEPLKPLIIYYKGQALQKRYCADFVCAGPFILELKAIEKLTSHDEAQLLNYLHATRYRVGVLINFGNPDKLEWKRMVL